MENLIATKRLINVPSNVVRNNYSHSFKKSSDDFEFDVVYLIQSPTMQILFG